MLTDQLIKEIRTLSDSKLDDLLIRLFRENHMCEGIENLGYLKLSEESFAFWNDSREDIYKDYARKKSVEISEIIKKYIIYRVDEFGDLK